MAKASSTQPKCAGRVASSSKRARSSKTAEERVAEMRRKHEIAADNAKKRQLWKEMKELGLGSYIKMGTRRRGRK
ncbi:unnamed protein product [Peniophora sp. CBMAI 1063]|nr:unnamed protein product [Peniophora sp. CBMAI 1063]